LHLFNTWQWREGNPQKFSFFNISTENANLDSMLNP
jgi:hypothetical protein